MRIVSQQTILMKYHALFVNIEKAANLRLSSVQIVGGALWVSYRIWKLMITTHTCSLNDRDVVQLSYFCPAE